MSTPTSDPEQIRRDIERTQSTLSRDVDVLTEKVSPASIVGRRVDQVRGTANRWKERVMGSTPTSGGIRVTAQRAAETASDTVSDTASSVAEAAQQAPQAVRQQTQGNPLAAGLIAFGLGWLASSLVPATRREREVGEQAREHAAELARPLAEAAGEVRDQLSGPAQHAVESVQSRAAEAGQTVAEEGRSAAGQVQEQASESAGTVRQHAQQG